MYLEIGKVYTVKANPSHNFKEGEQVEVVSHVGGILFLAKSLDSESEVSCLFGKGMQAIDAGDIYEEVE